MRSQVSNWEKTKINIFQSYHINSQQWKVFIFIKSTEEEKLGNKVYHLMHTRVVTSNQEINMGKNVQKTEDCTLLVQMKISTDITKENSMKSLLLLKKLKVKLLHNSKLLLPHKYSKGWNQLTRDACVPRFSCISIHR